MQVGFVGWRGMVGSVLVDRMRTCGDFDAGNFESTWFTTSQAGQEGPDGAPLVDAFDLDALLKLDCVITCQGGAYTDRIYTALRERGFRGHWIDAASTLRMDDPTTLILDPVNANVIDAALDRGCTTWAGANCTVSLLMMAVEGLLRHAEVEWISTMTYQAASGGGARHMRELLAGMERVAEVTQAAGNASVLEIERRVTAALRDGSMPTELFEAPLAASLIPWIDRAVGEGRTREEWKASAEANKMLATSEFVPIDGICVRVGALRCHSQGLTIKLKRDLPFDEVQHLLGSANPWVKVVDNEPHATRAQLTPAAVSGTLDVPIGRLHQLMMGPQYWGAFTVGDQLLWGAAEPLRRMLQILLQRA